MGCISNFQTIKANAIIEIGNFEVETPKIMSINVSRSRGKPVSSASVQFLYDRDDQDISSETKIGIWFWGTKIFTGIIRKISISPSGRVAGELIVRIQAEDFMHRLQNKRYTRRQKSNGIGPVVFISSIFKRASLGFDDPTDVYDIDSGYSPIETLTETPNMAAQLKFVRGGETNTIGGLHPMTKAADPIEDLGGAGGVGGGFILHDHTSLSTTDAHAGGPAAAVYGVE